MSLIFNVDLLRKENIFVHAQEWIKHLRMNKTVKDLGSLTFRFDNVRQSILVKFFASKTNEVNFGGLSSIGWHGCIAVFFHRTRMASSPQSTNFRKQVFLLSYSRRRNMEMKPDHRESSSFKEKMEVASPLGFNLRAQHIKYIQFSKTASQLSYFRVFELNCRMIWVISSKVVELI